MPDSATIDMNVQQLGVYLREIRETRGGTLDEAARVTRIGKNYLEAIEEGMLDKLPNVAYVKGFLWNYARYLELSDDEIVVKYVQALSQAGIDPVEQVEFDNNEQVADDRQDLLPSVKGRWHVSIVLLALLIVTGYFINKNKEDPSLSLTPTSPKFKQVAISTSVMLHLSSARLPERVIVADVPAGKQDEPVMVIIDKPALGIVLRLKVNQDTSLNINIDGDISQQYDLKAGDLIEWKGEKFFTLDLDNAGSIEAEFNGRPIKSLGELGSSAHIVLRADSLGRLENVLQ